MALLAILPLPASAAHDPRSMIIPSEAIGPFRLGMAPGQVRAVKRSAPCNVDAAFEQGRVTRLETNCGGAYTTIDRITVGMEPNRILQIFGTADRVTNSTFANTEARWLHYTRYGIAFRIVYGTPGNALIQAIAVFPCVRCVKIPKGPAPQPAPLPPPDFGD